MNVISKRLRWVRGETATPRREQRLRERIERCERGKCACDRMRVNGKRVRACCVDRTPDHAALLSLRESLSMCREEIATGAVAHSIQALGLDGPEQYALATARALGARDSR